MRYKDIRQHKKKPQPSFETKKDEFNNLTLFGEWRGLTMRSGPFCESALKAARKEMIRAFAKIEDGVA